MFWNVELIRKEGYGDTELQRVLKAQYSSFYSPPTRLISDDNVTTCCACGAQTVSEALFIKWNNNNPAFVLQKRIE